MERFKRRGLTPTPLAAVNRNRSLAGTVSLSSQIAANPISSRVVIASRSPFEYVGGLAAYGRLLGQHLLEEGYEGAYASVPGYYVNLRTSHACLPLPAVTIGNDARLSRWWNPIFSRMASRPLLHGLLERMIALAIPTTATTQAIGSANVIHFIGTGWDFVGFAFLHAARQMGVCFTVCPAVHPQSWGDDAIDIRLYRQADAVFCLSDHEKRHLASKGVPENKLLQCGLPPMCRMDGDRERFRTHHEIGNRPAVLFLGRRDEGKGYPALLRSWPLVLQKVPDAVLLLAGPGGGEYQSLLDTLPIDSFRDLQVPDEATKADALAGCDVFCLPSAHESFGIVYIEAWAYGKPVICGTAPASRELIHDGRTGIHSSQETSKLAHDLLHLLKNSDLARTLGAAGREEQRTRYSRESMMCSHLEAWRLETPV